MVKNTPAKKSSTAVAKPTTAPRGFEYEDPKDLLMPRVELLQSMSPAVQEGKGKAGDIVNQISKSPLPTDIFIPIAMQRKYIKWIPRSEGGGIEYQTNNPKDPRVIEDTKWGPHGEKPTCTAYMNFLILLEGQTLPIVLSFSMTNYQTGRELFTMCKMANCDMWLKKYCLRTKTKKNNMGTWFVFDVVEAGDTKSEDAKVAEMIYNSFAKTEFKVDLDQGGTQTVEADKDEDY
jgi:hypothetical protein